MCMMILHHILRMWLWTNDGSIDGDGIYVSADWVNISGLHIQNTVVADAGIELHSNHSIITGNNFSFNKWSAIRTYDSNYNNISGNFFYDNRRCVQLWESSNNIISGNQIPYCDSGIVLVHDCEFNIISNNHIIGEGLGISTGTLIYVADASNHNNITYNTISDCRDGIRTYSATSKNNFSGNIISNCNRGMSLPGLNRSIVSGNWITNCSSYGIEFMGSNLNSIANNIIADNLKHGFYLETSSNDNIISNNNIFSNEGNGLYLNNGVGILLRVSSHDNSVFDNDINFNGGHGIYLKDSAHDNTIFDNDVISNGGYGFYLKDFPYNNTISGNNVNSNIGHGFCLNDSSHDNSIIYNNVSLNNGYGILIENGTTACINNIVYRNNFVNNSFGGYDECNNTWDNGYPSGGNYWSGYNGSDDLRGQNQDIPGYDGIGDTPNIMHGGDNKDRYPLMYLWGEQPPVANYSYFIEYGGYIFNGSSSYDRDGVVFLYEWDFDDGSTGQGVVISHGYNESGTYDVTLTVTDDDGYQGSYTRSIEAEKNHPPSDPLIDGPIEAKAGKSHNYNFTSEDPELADVSYYIEWGDGKITSWCDFLPSGETYRTPHGWAKGTYTIRCKAKDIYGAESDWSTLEVTMPKSKPFIHNFRLISWLLERFPILQIILDVLRLNSR